MVRAPHVPDPVALAETLLAAGLPILEITLTTTGAESFIRACARLPGVLVGAGTVRTAADAARAADAGASFLVSPGVSEQVAEAAADRGLPLVMGALTPTEVGRADDLGAAAVKIFPASALGPRYLSDLLGPFPGLRLVPSGGVNAENAAEFLHAGAFAVTAGTSVIRPLDVLSGDWSAISDAAARFAARVAVTETLPASSPAASSAPPKRPPHS